MSGDCKSKLNEMLKLLNITIPITEESQPIATKTKKKAQTHQYFLTTFHDVATKHIEQQSTF
jgi:hypothetical protein